MKQETLECNHKWIDVYPNRPTWGDLSQRCLKCNLLIQVIGSCNCWRANNKSDSESLITGIDAGFPD